MSAAAQEGESADPSNSNEGSAGATTEEESKSFAPRTIRQADRAPPVFRTEPPWKLPGQPGAFVNERTADNRAADLRGWRSQVPQGLAEPPAPAPRFRLFGAKTWFIGAALIAVGASGYIIRNAASVRAPEELSFVNKTNRAVAAAEPAAPRETVQVPALPQLAIDAVRLWRVNEPASLTISYADAGSNISVLISGLAPGSLLPVGSAAAPNTWRLASTDLNRAAIKPPLGFVGVMNLVFELRLADNTVADRQRLQLEWAADSVVAPTAAVESSQRHLDPSEIALLMKRGAEWAASGNIGAARLMFQRAAEAGDPAAAFALAETYDPLSLDKLGTKGITPDIALAQRWYEQAKALGSTAAPDRLARLSR